LPGRRGAGERRNGETWNDEEEGRKGTASGGRRKRGAGRERRDRGGRYEI